MGSTISSISPLYNPTRSKRTRTLPVKRRRSSSSSVKTLYEAENLVDEKLGINNQPQEAPTLAYSPSYAISTDSSDPAALAYREFLTVYPGTTISFCHTQWLLIHF